MLTLVTVDQKWIDLWLEECACDNTRSNYRRDIGRFLGSCDKPFRAVTRQDVLLFRAQLEASGLGARSRNRALAALKSLFGYILDCEPAYLDGRNVTASVRNERFTAARRTGPDESQTALILAAHLEPVDKLALALTYFTGCRASEIQHIRWSDMVPSGEVVKIHVHGKGHDYDSEIPIELYLKMRELCAQDPPLPLNRFQLYRRVKRAAKMAGVPEVSPHRLRHACATHLARAGVEQRLIGKHLGHKSIQSTQVYFDQLPDESVIGALKAAVNV